MKDGTRTRRPPTRSEKLDRIAMEQQAEYGRPKIVRKAEIASDLAELQVIRNILNTPVTLPMREVLASSKELSDQLRVMIKRKNTVAAVPVVSNVTVPPHVKTKAVFLEGSQERLITLNMMCGEYPITAIIDTGSQLNVVSEECWKQAIGKPMDMKQTIEMNDANGGKGTLSGLVSDVALSCGAVKTKANLYIGKNAPFDMLLGRPWQLGNLVCIDERIDGTYLQFKDPNSYQPRFEVLTNPERPIGRNNFGRTQGSSRSMFLQVLEEGTKNISDSDEGEDSPPPLTEASDSGDEDSLSDWEWITPSSLKNTPAVMGHSTERPSRLSQDWRNIINLHQMGPDWSRTVGNKLSQAKEASVIKSEHSHGCEDHALSMCCKLAQKQLNNGHSLSKYMGKPKSHIKEASEQRDTHLQGPNQPMEAHIPSPSTHYFETRIELPLPTERSAEIATSRAVDQIGQAISD